MPDVLEAVSSSFMLVFAEKMCGDYPGDAEHDWKAPMESRRWVN